MYHSFLIHSSADGHLGYFHVLAIINSAAMKTLAPWKKNYGKPRQCIKNQDITLPTKVHIVKAMVFAVVMYGCDKWTIKKAEHQRIDTFEL